MKKHWRLGVGVALSMGLLGALWWSRSVDAPTTPETIDIGFDTLGSVLGPVRLSGTAHYGAFVKQTTEASLFFEAKTTYSYGLFPKGDVLSKEIRVLVRTEQPLPANIDFGYIKLEGTLESPTSLTVPGRMEDVLGDKTGYYFSPDLLVLRPWQQESIAVSDEAP
jgi:hypothetical protein